MKARRSQQLNVRSAFLRERVPQLAAETGLTATEVLEEAVRAYRPLRPVESFGGRLHRKGKFLVFSSHDGRPVTLEQTNAAIEADRSGERD